MRLLSAEVTAYIHNGYQKLEPATNPLYNLSHCSNAPITGAANKAISLGYNHYMPLPKSFSYVPALLYTNEVTSILVGSITLGQRNQHACFVVREQARGEASNNVSFCQPQHRLSTSSK